jgi:hypothetical protein
MEECDGANGVRKVIASASMVPKNTPVFEPGNRMFDASATFSMCSPARVSHDLAPTKVGRAELGHSAITTIREDTSVALAMCLDRRSPIVDHVVAIPRSTGRDRDDATVGATNQDLCIT